MFLQCLIEQNSKDGFVNTNTYLGIEIISKYVESASALVLIQNSLDIPLFFLQQ